MDERFERGKLIAERLAKIADEGHGSDCPTTCDDDRDLAYFIERASQEDRRKGPQRFNHYTHGRRHLTREGERRDTFIRRQLSGRRNSVLDLPTEHEESQIKVFLDNEDAREMRAGCKHFGRLPESNRCSCLNSLLGMCANWKKEE